MWMKEFFDALSKVSDILNFGRLIFYPCAGFFVFYPILMIYHLLLNHINLKSFFLEMNVIASTNPWIIFGGSLVAGFLISAVGFVTVIQPITMRVKGRINEMKLDEHSFPFRYPHMRNKIDEDYQKWLIAEFYRYVEIVTYIPLGFLMGLALLFIYTMIYLFYYSVFNPFVEGSEAYVFLLFLSVLLGVSWFYIWEELWKPKVVEKTVLTYIRAKILLIHGIEDFQNRCQENKVPVMGK